jgi:hypothetical protein
MLKQKEFNVKELFMQHVYKSTTFFTSGKYTHQSNSGF